MFHRADDALDSTSLIIIQCDSGHQNSDLIACARYRIYDEALRARHRNKIQKQVLGSTHIMFIIRLPQQEVRSKFVGFQSDPWISVHIDDLKLSSQQTVSPEQAISAAISELFIGRFDRERKDIETISNIKPSLENSVQYTESDETGDSQSQESTLDKINVKFCATQNWLYKFVFTLESFHVNIIDVEIINMGQMFCTINFHHTSTVSEYFWMATKS